jgi:hypothetical protein
MGNTLHVPRLHSSISRGSWVVGEALLMAGSDFETSYKVQLVRRNPISDMSSSRKRVC